MQQIKKLKLEQAHALHQLAEDNVRLQRMVAHGQVTQSALAASVRSSCYGHAAHMVHVYHVSIAHMDTCTTSMTDKP